MSKPLLFKRFVPNFLEAIKEWKAEDFPEVGTIDMIQVMFWYCWFYFKSKLMGKIPEE
jgi:hypothetical protein